ncbi:Vgb family protein [Paraliomyxa miuraensis]|uniref:Vgb family protein n=1 Tax=Paraliomyxa miuraensis TaxID=376150 RepID=UPI00225615D9|nr:hypothetical protein [Paraliomyxa miuraensis]MCX4240573.1 hypothetical protein [Paraliomyxa miuraensis]
MNSRNIGGCFAAALSLAACGGEGGREDEGGEAGFPTATITATATAGSATEGEDADASATQGSATMGSATMGTATTVDPDDTGSSVYFDVGSPDGGADCSGMMGDGDTHSYIWIANSSQGTVSKINTETLVEEGRYRVRPDSAGNPSRTSVALSGNVAVANRAGGVVKIYTNTDECQESNGMPGIQTSTGAADILAWGVEECVAWYTPFDYQTQRPLAWAQGTINDATCQWENEKLWTSGRYGAGNADVLLLDGETGVVEATAVVPSVIGWAGLYGGAVDSEGNFWSVDHNWDGPSTLVRVERATMAVSTWPVTGSVHYGLAVDPQGRAWLCGNGGVSRFDPITATWTHSPPINGGSALGGCMTDDQGTLWHSPYPTAAMYGFDTETLAITHQIPIPAYCHGVSIDFDGNVWGVQFGGSDAYRIDPVTQTVDTVTGLVGAYTYSDMTGFALSSVGVPSG